jgi:cell division protease FtsH
VVYGSQTTGAENYTQQATDIVRQMATRWGISDTLGPVALAPPKSPFLRGASEPATLGLGGTPYSETTASLIDTEVRRIIQENYKDAMRLIRANRKALDALAEALVEHETLDEDEILLLTGLQRQAGDQKNSGRQVTPVLAPGSPVSAGATLDDGDRSHGR